MRATLFHEVSDCGQGEGHLYTYKEQSECKFFTCLPIRRVIMETYVRCKNRLFTATTTCVLDTTNKQHFQEQGTRFSYKTTIPQFPKMYTFNLFFVPFSANEIKSSKLLVILTSAFDSRVTHHFIAAIKRRPSPHVTGG